ncbi:MAG: hypothetical protein A2Y73_00485 [Chloroflexi bacterium RBG_13_56_8]|nr:MAG: hypothetical protein A2Y73_00485 [Chloroflexi bacterium RBG_13_56_8]
MQGRWGRISRMIRLGGIAIILALLGIMAYQLYMYYSDQLGFTPTEAVETYFQSLAQGDYEEVYRLTAKEYLTDIYGRPITKAEFFEQLNGLTGDRSFSFHSIEATEFFERDGARYYVVALTSSIGGTSGGSRLLVEVQRNGGAWVVTYPFAIVL